MSNNTLMWQIRDAIRSGNDAEAIALIDSDPNRVGAITPFGSWLHVASHFGRLRVVRHLVQNGADLDQRSGISGGAPINEAASEGHLEVVDYLLSVGATLDTTEPERNPLFSAIYGGHMDVVQRLLSHGIDTKVRYTGEHMTNMDAVAFAVERGQLEIARLLADQG